MSKQGQATTAAAATRNDEELIKAADFEAELDNEASDAEEQPQSDASKSDNDAEEDDDGDAEPQDESDFSDGGDVDDGGVADGESDEEVLEAVGFGDAMNKILQQNVAEDAQPILAKRTTARMREILSEKKQTKTARLSAAEKRMKEEKDMIIPDHTTLVKDRQLRAIATKGGTLSVLCVCQSVAYRVRVLTHEFVSLQWWRYSTQSSSTSTRRARRTRRAPRKVSPTLPSWVMGDQCPDSLRHVMNDSQGDVEGQLLGPAQGVAEERRGEDPGGDQELLGSRAG
jgi:hypothetical protein